MKQRFLKRTIWVLFIFISVTAVFTTTQKKPLDVPSMLKWKSIRSSQISPNGLWMAYYLAPAEGDSQVILRSTKGKKEYKFKAGVSRRRGNPISFSQDNKWLAFTRFPTKAESKKQKKIKKPARNKLVLVNLITGKEKEFAKIRSFSFNGDLGKWIAMARYSAGKKGKDSPKGSDLILRKLSTGLEYNFGNVREYAFNKKGDWLALTLDALDQAGNGVWLRNMTSGKLQVLDSGKFFYERINWTEEGDAFTVLKGEKNKDYENKLYQVLGFKISKKSNSVKTTFDSKKIKKFPRDWTVSPNRSAAWTRDLSAFTFGIHDAKITEKAKKKREEKAQKKEKKNEKKKVKPEKEDDQLPKMVIWHWKDKRLQSQQWKQKSRDEKYSYLCCYHPAGKKFLRLADKKVSSVSITRNGKFAVYVDDDKYSLLAGMDGRYYKDVYVIDLKTGKKALVLEKIRWFNGVSPKGTHLLYYKNRHYYTYDLIKKRHYNITENVPASFVNREDDHWVIDPPIRPRGWLKNDRGVLLYDNWDLWIVPAHGGKSTNLTINGKKNQLRYQRRFRIYPREKGIDFSKPQYFTVYGEWTKKRGIIRIDKGRPGPRQLLWDDAYFRNLSKAEKADIFLYTRETCKGFPNYLAAGRNLKDGRKLTDANPQQKDYAWSAGVQLVNYKNSRGRKLQGALYLPANYQKGKKYPTMIYMYEKLSQRANMYRSPRAYGYDHTLFLSNGYAVLNPDIVYEVNDPGKSSVDCIIACLDAAVKTGIVDNDRVGINGWSWGGYQTAFMITQNNRFKAAFAAASLTNMISMYSSIYWNVGISNMGIFESSQGRFKGGYWDNLDAYQRNSPVYHAQKVKTPLLLLQNDLDGAVDYNQGIEYFNTLRRQNKEVVMLEYKGENHGLRKTENQRDLCVRVKEFFDHYLMGKPAPEWWTRGVDYISLKKHLKARAKLVKPEKSKKAKTGKAETAVKKDLKKKK